MANWVKIAMTTGLIGLAGTTPTAAQTTSLADALVQAYTTNPQLTLQQSAVRIADEDVINQRGDLLPTVTQTGRINQTKDLGDTTVASSIGTGVSLSTRVGIQLYDGGADRLDIDSAKMSLLASRQQLKDTEQSVLLQTVQAYIDVRRDQGFCAIGAKQRVGSARTGSCRE